MAPRFSYEGNDPGLNAGGNISSNNDRGKQQNSQSQSTGVYHEPPEPDPSEQSERDTEDIRAPVGAQ